MFKGKNCKFLTYFNSYFMIREFSVQTFMLYSLCRLVKSWYRRKLYSFHFKKTLSKMYATIRPKNHFIISIDPRKQGSHRFGSWNNFTPWNASSHENHLSLSEAASIRMHKEQARNCDSCSLPPPPHQSCSLRVCNHRFHGEISTESLNNKPGQETKRK